MGPAEACLGVKMISAWARRHTFVVALATLVGLSGFLVVVSPGAADAGVSWSSVNPALPSDAVAGGGITLASSSCPADGWCIAVGSYPGKNGSTYYSAGLIDSESGGTWTATESPLPSNALAGDPQAYLEAVTCVSVGSCVAVGRYLDSSGATQGLVLQLSNGVWSPSELTLPADGETTGSSAYAQLSAVACPSSGWCTALGLYTQSSGSEQALVATDVGGSWSVSSAPLPAAASGSQFIALSCPALGSCVATGTYLVGGNDLGMVDSLSGGTWTATAIPVSPGTSPQASIANDDLAVSCPAVGSCVVAGTTFDGNYEGLIDTLSSGTWTPSAVGTPGGQPSTDVQLTSVACTASTACVATGLALESGAEQGIFETLASGTWTPSAAPTPAGTLSGTNIEVHDVACPTAGTCVAVGQSDLTGTVNGLLWNLAAGSWAVTAAPLPSDANASSDPSFSPIACPGAGVCIAVGTYLGAAGREGVVETDPSLVASTTTLQMQQQSTTSFTYSATVTGTAGPTGTVVFSAGLRSVCSATLSNGVASCNGPNPPASTIVASYSGDGSSAPSWGSATSPSILTAITAMSGYDASARINTFFGSPLQVKVINTAGAGVPGVVVTFSVPPESAQSAYLWGSATAVTNAAGVATAPVLSANAIKGLYWVVASATGVPVSTAFLLQNTK
ncbi:MAG: Ig-like domain repeat protein [Acidimicrobiales bacterium]